MFIQNVRYLLLVLLYSVCANASKDTTNKEGLDEEASLAIMLRPADDEFVPYCIRCGVEKEVIAFLKSILDEDEDEDEDIDSTIDV